MFRDITMTWQLLRYYTYLRVRQVPVAKYYICATDLTNMLTIMRGGNNTSRYFNCAPPTVHEYCAARVVFDAAPPELVLAAEDAHDILEQADDAAPDAAPVIDLDGIRVVAAMDAFAQGEDLNGDVAMTDALGQLRLH